MSDHWISTFHYSNWLKYIFNIHEEIINDVVCKEQYMEHYSGQSFTGMATEYSTKDEYSVLGDRVTHYITETKPQYVPNFSWSHDYVVIINKKYTVYLGMNKESSEAYVKAHFPIGSTFSITTYASSISTLSTDKTTSYLWPKIQPH